MRAFWLALLVAAGCGDVVKTQIEIELCTNGLDDEGPANNMVDCEDPQCGEITTCVPTATDDHAGIVVAATEACPEGFEGGEQLIHRGLQPGTCEGCGCEVGTTTCDARVWLYGTSNECFGDVGLSGGTQLGIDITTTCTTQPIYYTNPGGLRVDIVAQGTCASSGTPIPAAADWSSTMKFCRITQAGNGCAADHACVPKTSTPVAQCALADGAGTCAGFGMVETDWYTGVDDRRTCGACFCSAVGGDCGNMQLEVGSDYSCGPFGNNLADNTQLCFPGQNAPYSPCVSLIGTPTPAAGCTASSTPSGTIMPTGQQTLCCSPQT